MRADLPDHWEPRPSERTWYSHVQSGDRGYLVRREGVPMIRYDNPMQERLSKLDYSWKEDLDHRPMNMAQLAQIAFVADQALCHAMGLHDVGRRDWLSLKDQERMDWLNGTGPAKPKARRDLYRAVWASLQDLAK